MRRSKPPQDHVAEVTPPSEVTMRVIGHIRSPYRERYGTPRQAVVTEGTLTGDLVDAQIQLLPDMQLEPATAGLAGFDYVWVLAWLHLNHTWSPTVMPPRGPRVKQGVFATRSPNRPNPIGLSALRLISVDGLTLQVRGIDLLDQTPVLDIKPYVPYADAFPDARAGWLDAAGEPMDGPDLWRPAPGTGAVQD